MINDPESRDESNPKRRRSCIVVIMVNRLIRFGSCMAPNADPFLVDLVHALEQNCGISCQLVKDLNWPARELALDRGEIELGWICGLPYVWKADSPQPTIRLLAAPVMAGERYAGKPVYYSDVVVAADSPFIQFDDLKGSTWGYNETRSHSGYYLVRYELANRGLTAAFFGNIMENGSHEAALRGILSGEIDAAAIDSTVLETEMARNSSLRQQIRVIATFGPSPIPPFVASNALDPIQFTALQRCLLTLHHTSSGRQTLAKHRVLRFVPVVDSDYDPIRTMASRAEEVEL